MNADVPLATVVCALFTIGNVYIEVNREVGQIRGWSAIL